MEVNAWQDLIMSQGDLSVFFSTTISTVLLLASLFVVLSSIYSGIRKKRP